MISVDCETCIIHRSALQTINWVIAECACARKKKAPVWKADDELCAHDRNLLFNVSRRHFTHATQARNKSFLLLLLLLSTVLFALDPYPSIDWLEVGNRNLFSSLNDVLEPSWNRFTHIVCMYNVVVDRRYFAVGTYMCTQLPTRWTCTWHRFLHLITNLKASNNKPRVSFVTLTRR